MSPLNFKGINEKFLQFLLIFSITVIVLLFAFYFNFRLPLMENKMLRAQIKPYSSSLQDQENVKAIIDTLQNYLNKYSIAESGEADILSGKIINLIPKLSDKAKTGGNDVLNVLCANYDEMYKDKNRIKELRAKEQELDSNIIDLQSQITTQATTITTLNDRITALISPN